ncbi:hypothetical protein GCM10029964_092580 [Kibdelosporangium lantanae]
MTDALHDILRRRPRSSMLAILLAAVHRATRRITEGAQEGLAVALPTDARRRRVDAGASVGALTCTYPVWLVERPPRDSASTTPAPVPDLLLLAESFHEQLACGPGDRTAFTAARHLLPEQHPWATEVPVPDIAVTYRRARRHVPGPVRVVHTPHERVIGPEHTPRYAVTIDAELTAQGDLALDVAGDPARIARTVLPEIAAAVCEDLRALAGLPTRDPQATTWEGPPRA